IESIRSLVKSGLHYEPHPYLAAGQLVQIEQGALAGLIGLITEVKGNSRLILSINLLMRSVSAEIDRSCVRPINPSSKHYFDLHSGAEMRTHAKSQISLKTKVS